MEAGKEKEKQILNGIEQKMQINAGRAKRIFHARALYLITSKGGNLHNNNTHKKCCNSNAIKNGERRQTCHKKPFLAPIQMMRGILKASQIEWIVCKEREQKNNKCFWKTVV